MTAINTFTDLGNAPQRHPAQRAFLILACTLAGAAWLTHKGPMPVIRISTPLPVMAPTWYMLMAFPVLGMLVADLADLWRRRGLDRVTAELGVMIALIVALSSLRLGVRIPVSGHALLAVYFIARRLALRAFLPRRPRWEVAAAVGALGAIAYPKLFWWNDPVTLWRRHDGRHPPGWSFLARCGPLRAGSLRWLLEASRRRLAEMC